MFLRGFFYTLTGGVRKRTMVGPVGGLRAVSRGAHTPNIYLFYCKIKNCHFKSFLFVSKVLLASMPIKNNFWTSTTFIMIFCHLNDTQQQWQRKKIKFKYLTTCFTHYMFCRFRFDELYKSYSILKNLQGMNRCKSIVR